MMGNKELTHEERYGNYLRPKLFQTGPPKSCSDLKVSWPASFCIPLEPLRRFDLGTTKELGAKSKTVYNLPQSITILTYNVWFESYNIQNRQKCIISLMEDSNADFICLQEVTQGFIERLHKVNKNSPLRSYYCPLMPMHWYDTLILSKFQCQFYKKGFSESAMDRSMLLAEVPFKNEGSLVVGSMHFESLNSEKTRIRQMNEVYAMTKDGRRVIIAGDHNFGDGSVENKSVPEEFRDLWLASNGRCKDCETMPKTNKFPAWRPDRIFYRGPEALEDAKVERVGNFTIRGHEKEQLTEIEKDGVVRCPSDHFGLVARISLSAQVTK